MISLTNLNAMRSAAAMADSNADIKTSMERLSTGSRINSASDDAAGMAIAERMTSQILEMGQAITNASNGISLINTADSAMADVEAALMRMRELSIQAINGTNNVSDRTAIDLEYQDLKTEIDRIGANTQWNGKNLFDGLAFSGSAQFLVGSRSDQTVSVALEKLSTESLSTSYLQKDWEQLGPSIFEWTHRLKFSADGSILARGSGLDGTNTYGFNPVNASRVGTVELFQWTGTSWEQLGESLKGTTHQDNFGIDIALSADGLTVAITDPKDDPNHVTPSSLATDGETRVFQWNGTSWVQKGGDIVGESDADWKANGVSMSADGNTIAIGQGGSAPNRVIVYDWSGSNWIQRGSTFTEAIAGEFIGYEDNFELSGDGNSIILGSTYNSGSHTGQAKVFKWTGSSWSQVGSTLTGSVTDGKFGHVTRISEDGQTISVANRNFGTVKVFEWSGSDWQQRGQTISPINSGDGLYMHELSDDGLTLAVQATNDGRNAYGRGGYVQVYSWSGTSWDQVGSDILGDPDLPVGKSLALSGDGERVAYGETENYNWAVPGNDRIKVFEPALLSNSGLGLPDRAEQALRLVDASLRKVQDHRSHFGAAANTLEHAVDNLQNNLTSTVGSVSQIEDADYAKETSKLAAAQVMREGAKSMLAQANYVYPDMVQKLISRYL